MYPENHCILCCEIPPRAASHNRSPQSIGTTPFFNTTVIQEITKLIFKYILTMHLSFPLPTEIMNTLTGKDIFMV